MPSISYTAPAERFVRPVPVKLVIVRCVAKIVQYVEAYGRCGRRSLLGVPRSW